MGSLAIDAKPARSRLRPIDSLLRRSAAQDRIFSVLGWIVIAMVLGVLGLLLWNLVSAGFDRLNWAFLTSYPSRRPTEAGIFSPLLGSLLVILVTGCIAIPVGVAAGVYLEEYAGKNRFTSLVEINIANLASVPSIIYGLMALGLFIYKFEDWFGDHGDGITGLGQSILTAGLTLSLLALPVIIVATREALRSIPQAIREAAYALGASRWQVVRQHLLPYSMGGISTGVIIAISRAIGETAPLVTVGALAFIAFRPPIPFEAKGWNTDVDVPLVGKASDPLSAVVADADATPDNPGAAGATRPIRTGLIELAMRQAASDEQSKPGPARTLRVEIAGSEATRPSTLADLVGRIDALDGLGANLDDYSTLHIVPDAGTEWCIVNDTTGVSRSLRIHPGAGRHGPGDWLWSPYTVLPIQMFDWLSRPEPGFLANAATTGVVLMLMTLGMNTGAIVLRARMRRRIKW